MLRMSTIDKLHVHSMQICIRWSLVKRMVSTFAVEKTSCGVTKIGSSESGVC